MDKNLLSSKLDLKTLEEKYPDTDWQAIYEDGGMLAVREYYDWLNS